MSAYVVAGLSLAESDDDDSDQLEVKYASASAGATLAKAMRGQWDGGRVGRYYGVWLGDDIEDLGSRQPDYVVMVSTYTEPIRLDPQHLPPVVF